MAQSDTLHPSENPGPTLGHERCERERPMRFIASFFVLALVACGGSAESVTDPSSSPAPSGSSSQSPGTSENPESPEGPYYASDPTQAGVFHKEQVDATNLRIDSNYHFEWTISGCDFGGGDEGRWESHSEGGIVLLPNTGKPYFEWSHEGFKDRAVSLRLTHEGDDVKITGSMEDGSVITQTWKGGCACAVCGGNLGPTGQEECKAPLPEICVPVKI
jgi:hypothetical protein